MLEVVNFAKNKCEFAIAATRSLQEMVDELWNGAGLKFMDGAILYQ